MRGLGRGVCYWDCLGGIQCLFVSFLCTLNCNILWQANQKMSFLHYFAPSVISSVSLWNSALFPSEFGTIVKAEILLALQRHKGVSDTFCKRWVLWLASRATTRTAPPLAGLSRLPRSRGKYVCVLLPVYTVCTDTPVSVANYSLWVLAFPRWCILRLVYGSSLVCEADTEYRFFVTNPGTTVIRSCCWTTSRWWCFFFLI